MKKVIYQTLVLSLILSTHVIAQQRDLWTTFTTADGLADNNVRAIYESRDGALWFGTGGGVSRYDVTWKTFTTADGLADNHVTAIYASRDGALWFGTYGGGVSRYDVTWKTFTTADGLTDNHVSAIHESRDGALWFGTYGGGVSRYQEGVWRTFTTADGLADNDVRVIHESRDGALWFGTYGGGVSRYQEGIWKTFTWADGLTANDVLAIHESRDGALWFGTYGGGVSRYQEGIWKTFTTANGLASNFVNTILESRDGALWFGTGRGVSRYHESIWKTFTTADGLAHDWVTAIHESRDGAWWFGTSEGVSRYHEGIWKTFTTADGLADDRVNAIHESRDGALWFGSAFGGVSRYQEGIWKTFTTVDGLADNNVSAILESRDGALWFGTSAGVSRYQEGIWKTFTTVDGLADNNVSAILESRDGALWFGTGEGVSRYQEGIWKTFTTADGLADNHVTAIHESRDRALWFGTYSYSGGVSRYQEGIWKTFTMADGLASNYVNAIHESPDGALWFGTDDGGVSRYQEGIWKTFTTANGLATNYVGAIHESRDGALWFGTGGGVSRYHEGIWKTFTTADGLASNYVSAIHESRDRALWFGTYGGGVSLLKPDKSPPFTFITKKPKKLIETSTTFFTFIGRDSDTPQEQFSYSWAIVKSPLIPDSSDWQPFEKATSAEIRSLENGIHIFYVRARDEWLNIDPTPPTWIFTVDITQPTVAINSPSADQVVASKTAIIGSAFDSSPIRDFKNYQFSYAYGSEREKIKEADWKAERFLITQPTKEIRNDTLAIWDTAGLPNGFYWLRLSAWDTLRHESHDFVRVTVVRASQTVAARQGSHFSIDHGKLEIYIPPGDLSNDAQLNVRDCPMQDFIPKNDDQQVTFARLCFKIEIAPNPPELIRPATLTLFYPDSLAANRNEKKLAFYQSADGKSGWQRLGGSVDVANNKITTTFKQVGVFALYEDLSAGNKAGVFNIASQPRMFSPQGGGFDTRTAISFELGQETEVTIKIYNTAGRLVRTLQENQIMSYGSNVVYWEGKDRTGSFCVTGLYLVTIQSENKTATKTVMVLNQ